MTVLFDLRLPTEAAVEVASDLRLPSVNELLMADDVFWILLKLVMFFECRIDERLPTEAEGIIFLNLPTAVELIDEEVVKLFELRLPEGGGEEELPTNVVAV